MDPASLQMAGVLPEDLVHETFSAHWMDGEMPFITPGELDPWAVEHLRWSGEASKPAPSPRGPQYPHSWVAAGLTKASVGHQAEQSASHPYHAHYDDVNRRGYAGQAEGHALPSQLATERALFMTPPVLHSSFPLFPGSPVSDPCGTPEMSHSSFGRWETDPESDDMQSSGSPHVSPHIQAHSYYPHPSSIDDCPTTLEMPDGSTRRTSNWLPVDSSAGFTIGPEYSAPRHGESDPHMQDFHDIQSAFFPTPSAGWAYDK
ncbi:hypothetical protein N7462_008336 [Penicillium macrosclerotiorum]|uniref:uncharacterized protein n=1 Tax=Penicillium macrosclerotiorum TaxID=303699 RepID=UPI002548A944|nr:uncharacterized protein N7462_008336 [Penicillium macrosclerotiorum]KAJ5675439.1 hypothetical protein N7462_008336 [Penicillium macrosclerotiorum]